MTYITVDTASEYIDEHYIYRKDHTIKSIFLLQSVAQNIELVYGTYDEAIYYRDWEYPNFGAVVLSTTVQPNWCDDYVILENYVVGDSDDY